MMIKSLFFICAIFSLAIAFQRTQRMRIQALGNTQQLQGSSDAANAEMFSADPAKEKPKPDAVPEEPVGALFNLEDILHKKDGCDYRVLGVDMPRVIPPGTVGNNREWLLWCQMRDDKIDDSVVKINSGRICFATSRDGLRNWKFDEDSPILGPNKENGDWFYFDAEHVGLGDVIQPGDRAQNKFNTQGGVYLMYIFGGRNEDIDIDGKSVKGSRLECGVCVSQDGAHWSKVEGPSPFGAIIECGEEGDFDEAYVGYPSVIEIGSEYRMYYHTYDRKDGMYKVGLAVAKDGLMKWTKKGMVFAGSTSGAFDRKGASRRHVVNMEDGTYQMWYEGISDDGEHSIGVATSIDGIKWTVPSEQPVFSANKDDPEAFDSGGVGSPMLVYLPTRRIWRMYYTGSSVQDGELEHHDDTGAASRINPTKLGVAESLDDRGLVWQRL